MPVNLTYLFSFINQTEGDFSEPFSQVPQTGLFVDANGDLFGTTDAGGANGYGTVFELLNGGAGYTLNTLVNFTGNAGAAPGADAFGGLIADANGNLFGATSEANGVGFGTVFELVKGSSGYTFTNLVNFTSIGAAPGANPDGALSTDANGDLFGTTNSGGANGVGTVFELVKGSAGYTLNTLVNFTGSGGGAPGAHRRRRPDRRRPWRFVRHDEWWGRQRRRHGIRAGEGLRGLYIHHLGQLHGQRRRRPGR